MFDEWIAIGLLSQAYALNAAECIELAQRVPCKFGKTSHNQAYDLKKIDYYAKEYARKLMGNSDQSATYSVYHLAINQWRGSTHEQAKATWDAGYKFLWDRNAMKEAFDALWPITRLFFITDLSVNKKQAVHHLAEVGYPLQNEVKGLTKIVVDGILASAESDNFQPVQQAFTTLEAETVPIPRNDPYSDDVDLDVTPERIVEELQNKGLSTKEIACRLDEIFTSPKLSNAALGRLLPANPGSTVGTDAARSQGKRLRGKK